MDLSEPEPVPEAPALSACWKNKFEQDPCPPVCGQMAGGPPEEAVFTVLYRSWEETAEVLWLKQAFQV